jgi:hypothetical protein
MKLSSGNVSGLCQRHSRWSGARTEVASNGVAKATGHANGGSNGHAHAAGNGAGERANGKRNKHNGHAPTPTNGHAAPPANGNGAAAVLPDLAGDFIEQRLNRLFFSLPVAEKSRIAQQYLRGEI